MLLRILKTSDQMIPDHSQKPNNAPDRVMSTDWITLNAGGSFLISASLLLFFVRALLRSIHPVKFLKPAKNELDLG